MAKPKNSAAKKPSRRKAQTDPNAPGAAAGPGHNSKLTFEQEQALFLQHRGPWNAAQAKIAAAEKNLSDVVATLKADGFTKKQFQIADELGKPKGEARVVGEVNDRIRVARFIGHPMGTQMDLFGGGQTVKVPPPLTLDACYGEGKRCSMENKPGRPPEHYAADQIQSFMAGFHEHQREIAGGIKAPLDPSGSTLAHQPS